MGDDLAVQEDEDQSSDWKWIRKGAAWGLLAAALCGLVTGAVAWHVPALVFNFWLRTALGFFCTVLLFRVVHWGAGGMTGSIYTAIVLVLITGILLSHSLVLALRDMIVRGDALVASSWLHPWALGSLNFSAIVGVGFAVVLCRDGAAVGPAILDILMSRRR